MMKRNMTLFLSVILVFLLAGCAGVQTPVAPDKPPAATPVAASTPAPQLSAVSLPAPAETADPAVVEGVNGMGIDMLKRLYPDMAGENFMISPTSISLALSMTMNGAEGKTLEQMRDTLHFTGIDMDTVNEAQRDLISILRNPDGSEKVRAEIANALWARQGIDLLEPFRDACREYYGADTRFLDFDDPEARDTINNWVDTETHGMIPTIVDEPIGRDTVLFLIDTLFFDGKWTEPFDVENTADGVFTKADGSTVTTPMMSAVEEVEANTGPDADWFGKTFGETGRLEMLFIRPKGDLNALIRDLSPEKLAQMIEGRHKTDVHMTVPRFSYDTSLRLNEVLIAMGMEDAFDEGRADLSGMGRLGRGNPYISKVLHKTRVEVKEEGAKAAAVTGVAVDTRAAGEPTVISLDKPFLYLIRDTWTGAVLFVGVVEQPVESDRQ